MDDPAKEASTYRPEDNREAGVKWLGIGWSLRIYK